MLAMRPQEAGAGRTLYEPTGSYITYFIGQAKDLPQAPQAFLVENQPDYVVKPHFHGVNQFQLIVDGEVRFGKHLLRPGSLHYADAFTPYGPIEAGPDGLSWFTIRQAAYHGLHEMPGSRHLMQRKAGRNLHFDLELSLRVAPERRVVAQEPDGLRVVELAAPAGKALPESEQPVPHFGAYLVVLAGSVLVEGSEYPVNSCLYVGRDAGLPPLTAGAEGARVTLLAFGPD